MRGRRETHFHITTIITTMGPGGHCTSQGLLPPVSSTCRHQQLLYAQDSGIQRPEIYNRTWHWDTGYELGVNTLLAK